LAEIQTQLAAATVVKPSAVLALAKLSGVMRVLVCRNCKQAGNSCYRESVLERRSTPDICLR
jgi:hypothetical protein